MTPQQFLQANPRFLLLETLCGSHAWKMNHAKSDEDRFILYSDDPHAILDGSARGSSAEIQTDTIDSSYHEAGHAVEQLMKGNINFIAGVCSPSVKTHSFWSEDLRLVIRGNPSKAPYNSINGLATQNYRRYLHPDGRGTANCDEPEKKTGQVVRVLRWGIEYLTTGKMRFDPVDVTKYQWSDIPALQKELADALAASNLPDAPDPAPFRAWLHDMRMDYL